MCQSGKLIRQNAIDNNMNTIISIFAILILNIMWVSNKTENIKKILFVSFIINILVVILDIILFRMANNNTLPELLNGNSTIFLIFVSLFSVAIPLVYMLSKKYKI